MPGENLHDKLFKQTFSVRSEAKAFVKAYLPAWVIGNLDFRTFKLSNTSFIDEKMKEYFSDLVYTCNWKGGASLKLSFLVEHKSYLPETIHLQLLRYLLEAYDYQKKQNLAFSVVIPIVVYHGKQKWVTKKLADHFDLPDSRLSRYIPQFDYELIDLNVISDELIVTIENGYLLRSTFLLFKHKDDKDFVLSHSKELFIFVEEELSPEQKRLFVEIFLRYVFSAFKFEKEEFSEYTQKVATMTEYVPGSLYDQAINIGLKQGEKKGIKQGIEKGIEQGIEKGIEQGIEQGKLILSLKSFLKIATGMPTATINDLSKYSSIPVKIGKILLKSFKEDSLVEIHKKLKKKLFSKLDLTKEDRKEINTLIKAFRKSRKLKSPK